MFLGDDAILIDMGGTVRVLGTTVVGGAGSARYALMGRVREYVLDFERYAEELAARAGVPGGSPVFLTAADLRSSYAHSSCIVEDVAADAHATFGLSGMACLGGDGDEDAHGTINLLLVLSSRLSRQGILDAFRIASEVKGALSVLAGLSCPRSAAVGTVSDATLVAAPRGDEDYSGLGTPTGRAIACATSAAFSEAISRLGTARRLELALGADVDAESIDRGAEALVRALRHLDLARAAGLLETDPRDVVRLLGELGRAEGDAPPDFTELALRLVGRGRREP
ncbi:MAG: adenosylcobinamide amidohydrolase [Conexivisphaera sp.]